MAEYKASDTDRVQVERAIYSYFETCREQVAPFVAAHFSWDQTLKLQKRFFLADLFLYPLNALWTIPYLAVKQIADSFQKLGLVRLSKYFTYLSSGIRTRYQSEIERMVTKEILGLDFRSFTADDHPLRNRIKANVSAHFFETVDVNSYLKLSHHLRNELDKYSTSRQFVSDLAGNTSLMGLGWILFGNHSLSLAAIGQKLARLFATDKAASNFIFGKNVGKSFYQLFPPSPTQTEVLISTLAAGLLFTISSICIHAASDPLRKKMSLHSASLHQFLDSLEANLLLELSLNQKRAHLAEQKVSTAETSKQSA